MPVIEWKSTHGSAPPTEESSSVVVFASEFAAPTWRVFVAALRRVPAITRQLRRSNGIVGFRLEADLRRRRMSTVSAWRNADALSSFATTEPHRSAMVALADRIREHRSVFSEQHPSQLRLRADHHLSRRDAAARVLATDPIAKP